MNHDISNLQPFIDGELSDSERAEFEAALARDPALRGVVEEQLRIRQVLRDLPRATAPQALRARVLLDLDAIDREQAAPAAPAAPRRFARLRAFFRGAVVMLPAGAAALALFVVARSLDRAPAPQAPPRDLAVRIVDVPEASPIRPVSLRSNTQVVYQIGGRHVVDRQGRADGVPPGRGHLYRGSLYHLGRGADGRPLVVFDVAGVRHTLSLDAVRGAPAPERDLDVLLELGHLVRAGAPEPSAR